MKKDDTIYLHHILDAIEKISGYVRGMSVDQFMQDGLVQDGVVRELEIIGEASRNLSDEFRQKYLEVPWSQIIGLRNRIIHAYFNVNLHIVWEIVHKDLPRLKRQVEHTLEEMV